MNPTIMAQFDLRPAIYIFALGLARAQGAADPKAYLVEHPELLAEAERQLRRSPGVRQIAKRWREEAVAALIEARRLARERVKEQWRSEGRKLADYSVRDVTEAAEAYLDQHRDELMGRACSNLSSRAQRRRR